MRQIQEVIDDNTIKEMEIILGKVRMLENNLFECDLYISGSNDKLNSIIYSLNSTIYSLRAAQIAICDYNKHLKLQN